MNNFDRIRLDRSSNFFDDLQALDQFKQENKFQKSNNPKSNQDSSSSSQSDEDKKQAILSKNKVKSQLQQNLTIQDQLLGGVHLDLNLKIKQDQDWEQSQKSEYSSQFYENEQDDLNRVIYDRSTSVNMRRRGKRLPGGVLNQIRREFSQQQIGNQKMASRFMPRLKEPFVIESQLLNLRGLFNMKILERLNAVVYDAKNIKSDFDRIQNTIVGHIKECTLAAQNIVKSLESKLIPKLNKEDFYETDDATLIQDIINQFYEKHQPSIATMEYNLKLIKQAITQADNLKLENRQIDLNLQYQVDVMDLRTDNTFGYSEVVGKLDEYTLALVMGDQVTDIVQFKQSDIDEKVIELKKLQQIQHKINCVLVHQDRIICDRYVYKAYNFEMIQELEHENMFMCMCVLSQNYILSGHASSGKLALWRWDGDEYQMIAKHAFMSGQHAYKVNQLEKDPYSNNFNVIVLLRDTLIQYFQIKCSQNEFKETSKRHLVKGLHLIQGFKILSKEHILVIMKQAVTIFDLIRNKPLKNINFNGLLSKRIITPANFNYESNALLYLLEDGKMKLLDLLNVGYKCSLDQVITHHVGTTVKIIKQKSVEENPESQSQTIINKKPENQNGIDNHIMHVLGIYRNQNGHIMNSIIQIETI